MRLDNLHHETTDLIYIKTPCLTFEEWVNECCYGAMHGYHSGPLFKEWGYATMQDRYRPSRYIYLMAYRNIEKPVDRNIVEYYGCIASHDPDEQINHLKLLEGALTVIAPAILPETKMSQIDKEMAVLDFAGSHAMKIYERHFKEEE